MADRSREQMASGLQDDAHRRQLEGLQVRLDGALEAAAASDYRCDTAEAKLEGERKVREAAVDAAKRAREEAAEQRHRAEVAEQQIAELVDELAKAELLIDQQREN